MRCGGQATSLSVSCEDLAGDVARPPHLIRPKMPLELPGADWGSDTPPDWEWEREREKMDSQQRILDRVEDQSGSRKSRKQASVERTAPFCWDCSSKDGTWHDITFLFNQPTVPELESSPTCEYMRRILQGGSDTELTNHCQKSIFQH